VAVTFNLGKLSQQKELVGHIVRDLLADTTSNLVSVNFQEAPSDVDFLTTRIQGWRTLRTRQLCSEFARKYIVSISCDFALFTFLYVRENSDILGVRTVAFAPDQFQDHGADSAFPVNDKYTDGCGSLLTKDEVPEPHWGAVLHEEAVILGSVKDAQRCHAVSVKHEDHLGMVTKATLITRYRVAYRTEHGHNLRDFVISTSHLGVIPKGKDLMRMPKRSEELADAVWAVQLASDLHRVPAIMTGDWNFRMAPFDEFKSIGNLRGLAYSGPVLELVDGKIQYGLVDDVPMRQGVAYEEMRVAAALDVERSHQDPMNYRKLFKELKGFNSLYSNMNTDWKRMPTCRFKEGQPRLNSVLPSMFGDFPTRTRYLSNESLSTAEFLQLDRKWDALVAEGYDLVKGKTPEVSRFPSQCDQIFWSWHVQAQTLQPVRPSNPGLERAMWQSDHNMMRLRAVI